MTSRAAPTSGAIAVLALFAFLGVRSALATTLPDSTPGQQATTLLQWIYGALALLAIGGLLARRAGTRFIVYAWAIAFTARNALAPVVWGGKGLLLGVVGGLVGLAIALPVVYLTHLALAPAGGTSINGQSGT